MKINEAKDFGTVVRKQRKALGYTQSQISEVTGLSVTFISDLENGKKTIELGKALLLANTLGLDCMISPRGEV